MGSESTDVRSVSTFPVKQKVINIFSKGIILAPTEGVLTHLTMGALNQRALKMCKDNTTDQWWTLGHEASSLALRTQVALMSGSLESSASPAVPADGWEVDPLAQNLLAHWKNSELRVDAASLGPSPVGLSFLSDAMCARPGPPSMALLRILPSWTGCCFCIICFLKSGVRDRQRNILHLLVHSPEFVCNSCGGARWKPGAWDSACIAHTGSRGLATGTITSWTSHLYHHQRPSQTYNSRKLELEVGVKT